MLSSNELSGIIKRVGQVTLPPQIIGAFEIINLSHTPVKHQTNRGSTVIEYDGSVRPLKPKKWIAVLAGYD